MGTLLYEQGVDRCFEELNITDPQRILEAHRSYVKAGANVLQTNTYAANRIKLEKYQLQDKVQRINQDAVRLAREAAGEDVFVVGTIGGVRSLQLEAVSIREVEEAFSEQLNALLEAGVDGILLETFYDLDEAKMAVGLARKLTTLPIIVQVSIAEVGVMQGGVLLENALKQLKATGANVIGLNCRMGPFHMLRSFEAVPLFEDAFLSAYPNASLPDYRDGRYFYQSNPDYFYEMGKRFVEQGIRLLGGCCGTTPEHIEAFSRAVKGMTPITKKRVKIQIQNERSYGTGGPKSHEPIAEVVKRRPSIIVELDPPKKLRVDRFLHGAKVLKEAGVDAVTMADNSLASPRVDNLALGAMVKEQVGVRPLVHVTCRDRNLIGLQSHLMGLHALGITDLLAITGDPTKVGDFPGASSVYDVSSFQLISLIKQLNEGISFSGKDLGEKASFSIGAALNPNVRHLERAVQRMEKKIESGADYFMTQPIYSEKQIEEVYEATKHIDKPIYIGIMPLTSGRNAEFLHNEVPGIKLTDDIRERMAAAGEDKEKAEREGIAIAKSLADVAAQYFNGIYLITPFLRYEMTVELTRYLKQKTESSLINKE
ncbi:bifunctional homocysteine S-methyltransferase/methylenetetrahydrofolate reductase [Halalkalibacterium ligniniphilum]|uniref:bifunctional homocysteine S-methyltransferase/methylenetetrahydrofolate reductase n=1 Tax=Halalkalibacterium ligniniphilum TaxID=1134413 RepID=UPI000687D3D7